MDLLQAFKEEARALLGKALQAAGHDGDAPGLERPPDPSIGDLGMPCFQLAKALKKAPAAIAEDLAQRIEGMPRTWVRQAKAVGPYCNLWVDQESLARAVLEAPDEAIRCTPTGRRILLEHTSANPNGPLHVGRARNPILGDALARLLRAAGHEVEVQYYMDNLGRQVAMLAWGHWNLDEADLPPVAAGREEKPDHVLVRYYQATNERMQEDPELATEIKTLVARLEEADEDLLGKVRKVYGACFEGMRQSLERLGVHYDSIKDESDVVQDGSVADTVDALRALPQAAQEQDGANYLDLSSVLKGQKDRFYFTRRDGTSVYATRDIAYHAWKARHVGDGHLVNVLGEDHRLQALQVGTALDWLGVQRPHVVFYAFVSLPDGKMSTRANRVVFLDDLLDEAVDRARREVLQRRPGLPEDEAAAIAEAVGIGAIRFNIARVQPEKPIKFRWEEALNFDGDSAPYILYAYARGQSLITAALKAGIEPDPTRRMGPGEHRLLGTVARMPGVIRDAADEHAPHRLCAYALELASAFNEYYRDHRVVGHEEASEAALRLAVVQAAHKALDHALQTLGMTPVASM